MTPERKTELTALANFARNTKAVITVLESMMRDSGIEKRIQDANWRYGDMSIMCDEVVAACENEMKVETNAQ